MSRIVIAYVNHQQLLSKEKDHNLSDLKYRKEISLQPLVVSNVQSCNSKRANVLIKIKKCSPFFQENKSVCAWYLFAF